LHVEASQTFFSIEPSGAMMLAESLLLGIKTLYSIYW